MKTNYDDHEVVDKLLVALGWALNRGPLAGLAEAQAAFDAASNDRLSANELTWLLRRSIEGNGQVPPPAALRAARANGQRMRTESLERRDATAPLWMVPYLAPPYLGPTANADTSVWDGGHAAASAYESSDWSPVSAISTALVAGGVAVLVGTGVWVSTGMRRHSAAQATRDDARLYDRALVELADGSLVA
jgi:hypothetical protein